LYYEIKKLSEIIYIYILHSGISHAATEMSQGSAHVKDSTVELNRIASTLEEMVGKFKID